MDKIEIPDFEEENEVEQQEKIQVENSVKYFQTAKKVIEEQKKTKTKSLIPVGIIKPKVPLKNPMTIKKPLQSTNIIRNEQKLPYPTDKNTIFVSNRQVNLKN